MAWKLIITLDDDMDRDDAQMIAAELEDHDGVAAVEGLGWTWQDDD